MKNFRIIAAASLFALVSAAMAQTDTLTVSGTVPGPTVSVTISNTSGADFGTTYAIGQLSTSSYVYGNPFILKLTYANVTTSVALAISGTQANYDLAYSFLAATGTTPTEQTQQAFGTIGTVTTSGTATDVYAKGTNNVAFDGFNADTLNATAFKIGARAQNTAVVGLSTTVTITATVN